MELQKFYYPILCIIPVLCLTLGSISGTYLGTDDAHIYFVYMRNIAENYGFVYQRGDIEVEGFTSVLWTLIGSVFYKIYSKPHQFLYVTNLLLMFFCFWQANDYIRNISKISRKYFYLLFILLVLLSPGFILWNVFSLLETGLWTFLVFSTVLNILNTSKYKNIFVFNLLLCLLIFTRPESLLLVPFFIFWKFAFIYQDSRNLKYTAELLLSSFLTFITSLLFLHTWRFFHFNLLFPNTYYAKASGSSFRTLYDGINYNFLFFSENIIYAVILMAVGLYIIKTIKKDNLLEENFKIYFLFSVLLLGTIIPVIGGSDHFGLYRFMQPLIPIFWLLAFHFTKIPKKIYLIAILCLGIFEPQSFFAQLVLKKTNPAKVEWEIVHTNRADAENLNKMFSEITRPSAGLLAAGAFAYYYHGNSIDLLGLNNFKMAHADRIKIGPKNHAAFSKKIFYEQTPDLIVSNIFVGPQNKEGQINFIKIGSWESQLLKGIQDDIEFRLLYGNYIIEDKKTRLVLKAYIKKKFVENHLINNPRYSVILE